MEQVAAYSCSFLRNNISTSNKRRDDYIKHPLLVKTGGIYPPIPTKYTPRGKNIVLELAASQMNSSSDLSTGDPI